MKESKWSDEQLQELLRQLPKIKDDRDPRDIYQAIEIKMGKQKTKHGSCHLSQRLLHCSCFLFSSQTL